MKVSISDIASLFAGHPFRGKIPEKLGSSIRVVQMKNISANNVIDWDSVDTSDA